MPYTSPAAQSSGNVAPVSWATAVKAATDYLANPPACRVFHNADQNIPHVTVTALAFNSERYDTDTMHDTVTNNSRITFTTAGLYAVTFTGSIALATDYTLAVALLRLNGATYIAKQNVGTQSVADDHVNLNVTTIYKFAATDYVEVLLFHRNGAAATRAAKALGNFAPEFAATWIGLG